MAEGSFDEGKPENVPVASCFYSCTDVNYDEATLAQVEGIQREVSVCLQIEHDLRKCPFIHQVEKTSEYVSEKEEVSYLTKEYPKDDVYQTKIKVNHIIILSISGDCLTFNLS